MNQIPLNLQRFALCALSAVTLQSLPLTAGEVFVVRTNWTERVITNLVEVRVPKNVFVNQYFTNYTDRYRTNTVVTYLTNIFTKTMTNNVTVNLVHTNVVTDYRTNWTSQTITKEIPVELVQTNFVALYRTNLQTLNFTNWQTVLVMTTNWVTQTQTNTVTINASEASLPVEPTRVVAVTPSETETVQQIASATDPAIEALRTQKPSANNMAEVQLKIRWPGDTADPLPVSQWRIERPGGNFLSFGQEQELKRDLPFGNYVVQAKLFRQADGASLVVRCTLKVGAREALVQQQTSGKKLLSSVP